MVTDLLKMKVKTREQLQALTIHFFPKAPKDLRPEVCEER